MAETKRKRKALVGEYVSCGHGKGFILVAAHEGRGTLKYTRYTKETAYVGGDYHEHSLDDVVRGHWRMEWVSDE